MNFTSLPALIEFSLIGIGLVMLWPYALSPEAQKTAALARHRADTRLRWDLSSTDFLLFIFCVITGGLATQMFCVPLLKILQISTSEGDLAPATLLLGGSFHGGMLLGVAFFRLALRREESSPSAPRPPSFWASGIAAVLMAMPLVSVTALLWQAVLRGLGVEIHEQEIVGIFSDTDSPLMLLGMGFLAVVLAPITEEFVFRAGLFRYLRTRAPRGVALALPALLFAAMHANLASFAPLAVLGIVFALAYERSGTIAAPILAHALFNLNTLLVLLAGFGPETY